MRGRLISDEAKHNDDENLRVRHLAVLRQVR